MDEQNLEKRLEKIERHLEGLSARLDELADKERKLHNLVLRLAATGMAVSEVLQKRQMIKAKEFEQRVAGFLKTLDQEISEKKTARYLENIWKKFEEQDE
ncbi:MAG TPA: hypothetical protein VM123_00400 [archaeon]|nr:hypothetical protein [archaeon]